MSSPSRGVVYSLLTVVFILLVGMMTILGVAYQRYQRFKDQAADLQRNLIEQKIRINDLQLLLKDCDTVQSVNPVGASRSRSAATDSARVRARMVWPGRQKPH